MRGVRLIERAERHGDAPAVSTRAVRHTYSDLLRASSRVAVGLLQGEGDLGEKRVAFLLPGSFEYAATQWGVWRAGGVAVPLSLSAAEPEIEHVLTDAEVGVVLVTRRLEDRIKPLCDRLGIPVRLVDDADAFGVHSGGALPRVSADRRAMILYTSGTTSKPKGVVSTHANVEAQVTALVDAWGWRKDDRIPLFLPLHHVHGIVNVLSCALWSGAFVEAFESFDRDAILERVGDGAYTVFMAVPTIYVKLIEALASGSRIVSTDCPSGPREILDGGRYGRLVPVGDAAALARALEAALEDDTPLPGPESWAPYELDTIVEQYRRLLTGEGS